MGFVRLGLGSIVIFLVFVLLFTSADNSSILQCPQGSYGIVETIPPDLGLPHVGVDNTFDAWMSVLRGSNEVVIAALFSNLYVPSYVRFSPDNYPP